MTRYIAAYDTESPDCLAACREILKVHGRADCPATFFIVGQLLESAGVEYRALLGDVPGIEIASHTYSHRMLRDHPFCGAAVTASERRVELERGKALVEAVFGRRCLGLRPGCGFAEGLSGDRWLVDAVAAAGYTYISSLIWGPGTTLPALLERPYSYAAEGHPELWELPAHGWHENVLKRHNLSDGPQRLVAWPLLMPEALPAGPLRTPEEEFALNQVFINKAIAMDLPYVSLIWHPWSLAKFDPEMRMLRLTLAYVQELGLQPTTFAAEASRLASGG